MRTIYTGTYRRCLVFLLIYTLLARGLSPQAGVCQASARAADPTEPAAQTDYGISNPRLATDKDTQRAAHMWDCIYFGYYWQSDTNDDGIADRDDAKEPILWRVLAVDGDDAFLMAERNIDYKPYHESEWATCTWEDSTIRSWLNGYGAADNSCGIDYTDDNFLNDAFSPEEQAAIRKTKVETPDNTFWTPQTEGGNDTEDQLYLLSYEEATKTKYGFNPNRYFTLRRSAKATGYTWEKYRRGGASAGGHITRIRDTWWWLRTPGKVDSGKNTDEEICRTNRAMIVRNGNEKENATGYVNLDGFYCNMEYGIRPVLHIDLSHTECWTYGGTTAVVSENPSGIKENFLPGPTPIAAEPSQPTPSPIPRPFPRTTDMPLPPSIDSEGVTTWDCVYFGNYWQNDTNGDGVANRKDAQEPIKWRVLSVDGDDAFLLADKVIAYQAYNEIWESVTWENCTIRSWLNGYGPEENLLGKNYTHNAFINHAFTQEERLAIRDTALVNAGREGVDVDGGADTTDKVYLLSWDDVTNPAYGFSSDAAKMDRITECTAYVKGRGGIYQWWLRTPETFDKKAGAVSLYVSSEIVDQWRTTVRPALHLNLAAQDCWSNAGTVGSDGKVTMPVKPTATPTGTPHATGTPTAVPTGTPIAPIVTGTPIATGTPIVPNVTGTPTATGMPSVTSAAPAGKSEGGSNVNSSAKPDAGVTIEPGSKSDGMPTAVSVVSSIGKVVSIKLKQKKQAVTVSWKKISGASGYQIWYSTSKKWKGKKQKLTRKNKLTLRKLKKRKTYYFRIRAYCLNGKEKEYGTWSKTKKKKIK